MGSWSNNSFYLPGYLYSGTYLVEFYGESEYVNIDSYHESISLNTIQFECYEEMDWYINITSEPPTTSAGSATLTFTPVVFNQLDNVFINTADNVTEGDGRPVTSAAVAEKFSDFRNNFKQTQSDWVQSDSSANDYIKNKPFGLTPGDIICNTAVSWVGSSNDMMAYWDNTQVSGVEGSIIEAGNYLISFHNNQTSVYLSESNGTINTDFITLSYS